MTWRIGMSSGACTELPILEMLSAMRGSGAVGIEVATPPRHFNPLQEDQVLALGRALQHMKLEAVSIHAPFGGPLDLADPNAHHRHAGISAVLTSAEAIKRLGGTLVVVHPSDMVRHTQDVWARLHDCAESLRIIGTNCRDIGVTVALESPLPHLIGGHPDEFAWLLAHIDDATRVCLDTGHTALGHQWHRFVDVAGSRLAHIHAHDNHGHRDDHLPPGDGSIDWAEILATLERVSFTGWIMLELMCPPSDREQYFCRAFEQASRRFGVVAPRLWPDRAALT